ncbi:hypothetical protein EYF80_054957 [Liparis tanakae]|uniref:Uncharacterized protein n=1 Tax=Liparis tanakae TaxID=230148 RepID=A0A4Z2F0Z6_9TELE|nr:hypothetical protein EYF80_054957 [Liparis tanakae]
MMDVLSSRCFSSSQSHQNILLVATSTSRATAFFSVGTTCVYSLFSRSMRRISWRLVNIRYGLFPEEEEEEEEIHMKSTNNKTSTSINHAPHLIKEAVTPP